MRLKYTFSIFVVLVFAAGAFAETLTMGNPWTQAAYGSRSGEGTFVDLKHPAPADGVVTRVGFALGTFDETCLDVATIKFFRPVDLGFGDGLELVAERTPVSYLGDDNTVPVSPPVKVRKGDLIGIHLLTNCGVVIVLKDSGRYIYFPLNVTGTVGVDYLGSWYGTGSLAVWGTGYTSDGLVGVLPVVGSAPGLHDSHWRTSLQLLNPHSTATSGRMIFRRFRVPGSDTDSSMPYSLGPGETKIFDDIVFSMHESGIGSIDLVSNDGLAPVALSAIFNDAGAGNFGMLDMAIDPEDHIDRSTDPAGRGSGVLRAGDCGFLLGPVSAIRARFNIGVRTLGEGASIEARLLDSSGNVFGTVTREYPPDFMEQMSVETFFALPLTGGEVVRIAIRSGSAIVYGSTVDNGTNDPSIQYVHAILRTDD